MYRATKNVTGQVYTKAKDYLGKINKGFQEGRSASDRPEFIRSSVIDTLRPGVLKMGLDKEGKYNGDELLGRLEEAIYGRLTEYCRQQCDGADARELHS